MIKKDLFDNNTSIYILGCLMHKPLLLQDEHYTFTKTDFYKPLHQLVFAAIFNLGQQGVTKILPQDVDLQLSQYDAQYAQFKAEKGYEFLTQCYELTEGRDEAQFASHYARFKKFAILRDLESAGIDTTRFYDTSNPLNLETQDQKLNNTPINAICESVRNNLVGIENKHIGKDEGGSQEASQGMRALVAELKQHPEVGLPLDGDIINFTTRGARKGKLYTYSAPSGAGKTRYMVGNACAISLPYLDEQGDIIVRGDPAQPDYQKVLYVATEQKADEIQTMILSYVSGVNENNILLGNLSPAEEGRINTALELIDKYGKNLIIETIPDPSINLIKARLTKYIVQDNVEYIFYDYIFSSPGLLGEFRDVGVREDVALMMLSNSLKEIAMNYKVFIQSATQLNDGWSKKEVGARDQNCLRGSKAIADKIDVGMIGVRLNETEKQSIEKIWSELRRTNPQKYRHEPNIVVDVYKNRRGPLNNTKIFRYFDYATCRCEDLFATDPSYKTITDIGLLEYDKQSYSYLDLKSKGAM